MSKHSGDREFHDTRIANCQRGIQHYCKRLAEVNIEKEELEKLLAAKKAEFKKYKDELEVHISHQYIVLLSVEENEALDRRMAEDHARRNNES